jgi:hypothetical protein
MPPAPVVFNTTPNQQGDYLNQTALNNYLKAPANIFVPVRVGNQFVPTPLSNLQARAGNLYKQLALPNGYISADDISTLVMYDAGLLQAQFAKGGIELDWNSALMWAEDRVISSIRNSPAYRLNIKFQQTLTDWKRAWEQTLQQRAGGGGQTPSPARQTAPAPSGGVQTNPQRERQNPPPNPPRQPTGGRIQIDRLDRQH